MITVSFQGKPFNITVIQVYIPTTDAEGAEVDQFYEDLEDLLELTPKNYVLFITGDWNAKVGSQEILGIIGKFGLEEQNEAGQRLTEFCQESGFIIANTLFQQCKNDFTHQFSLVQFSCSVMSDSSRPHGLQHTRPPCPSPTRRVYSNSCPLSQ